ncbi:glycoside hydrolase family 13 protein [Janibacter indicus]|uniref:glycoside hydrolase family 13 protein n=1 Tax=Janibacter indicus TaxID=857417 RepID=UPI003D9A6B5B
MTTGPTPFDHSVGLHDPDPADAAWWRDAVIYQIYPRSWADASGDGVGDLPGITSRLEHLRDLGVDAVWLSPFYRSPQRDAGYDVADHRDVDPLFGTLDDADAMIARAHDLGLRVVVDLVPNHTSSDHAWFQAALGAGPGSPERERYVFRDGLGDDGSQPPTNWLANFGGGAWTRVTEPDGTPGQWYLHLFDPSQPDLNWTNPQVREDFETTLRFWLDRGVDGFRVDVAHGLVKDPTFPPFGKHPGGLMEVTHEAPYWDQEGVHEIYRAWRELLDSYGEPVRIMCAEAWVNPADRLARYVREDEFHQAFNFDFLETPWRAEALRAGVRRSLAANDSVGAPSTWVLSNHDVLRHASRFGLPDDRPRPNGIGADDPQPDAELGLRRARAATTLMLALPGGAYVYQGEELGLPEHTALPDEVRQDPTFARTEGLELGRDGCRVPMAWEQGAPALGFSSTGAAWLPQPPAYSDLAVDAQTGVEGSTLELYRRLLALRRERRLGLAGLEEVEGLGDDVVGYVATSPDGTRTLVVANLGAQPVTLPQGAVVLVASGDLVDGRVPTDTAVWAKLA